MTTLRMQVVNSGTVQDPDVDDVLALTSTSDGQGALGLAASAVGHDAIADDAVGTTKLKPSVAGTPAALVGLPVSASNGASDDVGTFVADRDYFVVGGVFYKTAAAGDAGDMFQLRTAAGGAGSLIVAADLNVADQASCPSALNDSVAAITSGNTYHLRRVNGGGGAPNTACIGAILLMPA